MSEFSKCKANSKKLFWCNCAVKCRCEKLHVGRQKHSFNPNNKHGCQPADCIQYSKSTDSGASLRNLCEADKQRVRHLIVELAQADQMKDVAERELSRERCQFRDTLIQLNQQLVSLEREKISLQSQLNAFQEEPNNSLNHKTAETPSNSSFHSPTLHGALTPQSPVTLSSEKPSQHCTNTSQQPQCPSESSEHFSPATQSVQYSTPHKTVKVHVACESTEHMQSHVQPFHLGIPTTFPPNHVPPPNRHTPPPNESWVSLPPLQEKESSCAVSNPNPQSPLQYEISAAMVSMPTEDNSTIADNTHVTTIHPKEGYYHVKAQCRSSIGSELHVRQTNTCTGGNLETVDIGTQTGNDSIALDSSMFTELPLATAAYINAGATHDTGVTSSEKDTFRDVLFANSYNDGLEQLTEHWNTPDLEDKCWSSVLPLPHNNKKPISALDLAVSLNQHPSKLLLPPCPAKPYGSQQMPISSSPVDPNDCLFVEDRDIMNDLFFQTYQ